MKMNWGGMATDATRPQVPWSDVDAVPLDVMPQESGPQDWAPLEGSEPLTDDELAEMALAADPDAPLDDDSVSPFQAAGLGLLPDWYMPAVAAGLPLLQGWRRRVAFVIIASFLLINAYGLCSTYGHVGFG